MVQSSLNQIITFLGEKLWPVAWNKKFTKCYIRKKSKGKNANKKHKNENFEKQGSLNPNVRFLGQKLWPVAWNQNLY